MPFLDRADAGRRLAMLLEHLRGQDVVVVGSPGAGCRWPSRSPEALGAPLDVIVVRKLGVPFQPELGMGAIGEGGARVVDTSGSVAAGVSVEELAAVEASERAELDRRVRRFRGMRPPVSLTGRTVVIVDDGIATGSTARAACQVARARGAARVVLAVPVAPLRVGGRTKPRCRRGGVHRDAREVSRHRSVLRGLHPDERRRGGRSARTCHTATGGADPPWTAGNRDPSGEADPPGRERRRRGARRAGSALAGT